MLKIVYKGTYKTFIKNIDIHGYYVISLKYIFVKSWIKKITKMMVERTMMSVVTKTYSRQQFLLKHNREIVNQMFV